MASAASAGSLGAGKNVSGSTVRQRPRARHALSSPRSREALRSLGSRRAAATSCGRGIRARVMYPHLPRGWSVHCDVRDGGISQPRRCVLLLIVTPSKGLWARRDNS
jgi:hypothetical protein